MYISSVALEVNNGLVLKNRRQKNKLVRWKKIIINHETYKEDKVLLLCEEVTHGRTDGHTVRKVKVTYAG